MFNHISKAPGMVGMLITKHTLTYSQKFYNSYKVANDNIFAEACISPGVSIKHRGDSDENYHFLDNNYDDYALTTVGNHKKEVRPKLETRMERRRLKKKLEDDFDWDDHD